MMYEDVYLLYVLRFFLYPSLEFLHPADIRFHCCIFVDLVVP